MEIEANSTGGMATTSREPSEVSTDSDFDHEIDLNDDDEVDESKLQEQMAKIDPRLQVPSSPEQAQSRPSAHNVCVFVYMIV